MRTKTKINPAKASPQAPPALRTGVKSRAPSPAAPPAAKSAEPDDPDDPDRDDEDEDDEKDQAEHDAACASAAEACRAAAEAYDAATGTDGAGLLQAAEEASAAARDACTAGEASCAKMRGAEPASDPQPAPAAPPPPNARAVAAAAPAATAAAHLEVAQLAKLGRDVLTRTGATSADAAMLQVEAGMTALAEVEQLRKADRARASADNLRLRTDRLKAAVHAGMDRSKAFTIKPGGELGAPLAVWMRGTVKELDATLTTMGFPAGAQSKDPRASFIVPGGDDTEAGLAERARASGMTVEQRRDSEQRTGFNKTRRSA